MDALIKIGGSLVADTTVLKALGRRLSAIAKKYRIVVLPGGDGFADVVRQADVLYSLSAPVAHRMAILGMDQYGLLLSETIPDSRTVEMLDEAQHLSQSSMTPIILPSNIIRLENPLEASWHVTSDSIAAYFAGLMNARRLILVKDVDGVFKSDPKRYSNAELIGDIFASKLLEQNKRTCVDQYLPRLLLKTGMSCFVVNGKFPERIEDTLASRYTICTRILPK
jgi:aspartokinase-like uncharacterized kinase